MNTVELLYWEPHSTTQESRTVTTAAEVEQLADELLTRYQAAGDMLPGLELQQGEEGESLSIAVAATGWALIHTNADFDQHRTQADSTVEDTSADDVQWEEPTTIPRNWFVPKHAALIGISHWLQDRSLAPELTWSNQPY